MRLEINERFEDTGHCGGYPWSCFLPKQIYAHRATSEEDKEGSSWGFFRSLLHRRCVSESESQGGFFWRRWPLCLRDTYRPLNATRKRNMAHNLHDKDSSDEDEIFNKDAREASEVTTEKAKPTETTTEADEESELLEVKTTV
nr:leucine-rich repeat-containing protein 37A-like [Loxodonta africana]